MPVVPSSNTSTILGVRSLGNVKEFPFECQPRLVPWTVEFDGMLADGTMAPSGNYSILVRALRIFGDAEKKEDYDAVSTVPFTLQYA